MPGATLSTASKLFLLLRQLCFIYLISYTENIHQSEFLGDVPGAKFVFRNFDVMQSTFYSFSLCLWLFILVQNRFMRRFQEITAATIFISSQEIDFLLQCAIIRSDWIEQFQLKSKQMRSIDSMEKNRLLSKWSECFIKPNHVFRPPKNL